MLVEKQKPSEFLSFPNKNTLNDYVDLLIKANKKLNLISKSTENDIWERHILDSAQLITLFPSETKTVCDVGSGAGLPGVVLKIIHMSLNVTIVEPSMLNQETLNPWCYCVVSSKPNKAFICTS